MHRARQAPDTFGGKCLQSLLGPAISAVDPLCVRVPAVSVKLTSLCPWRRVMGVACTVVHAVTEIPMYVCKAIRGCGSEAPKCDQYILLSELIA